MGLIGYKNVNPQTIPQFGTLGVGTVNLNRNSIATGTDSHESPTIFLENLFSHSTPSHSTPSHSRIISLEEINELNRKIGASGGTGFLEEDDLDFLNRGVELRSGKTYGLKENPIIPKSLRKVPAKSPLTEEIRKLNTRRDKDDDDDDSDESDMYGSGQKRSLDQLDDYPFPVFQKKKGYWSNDIKSI